MYSPFSWSSTHFVRTSGIVLLIVEIHMYTFLSLLIPFQNVLCTEDSLCVCDLLVESWEHEKVHKVMNFTQSCSTWPSLIQKGPTLLTKVLCVLTLFRLPTSAAPNQEQTPNRLEQKSHIAQELHGLAFTSGAQTQGQRLELANHGLSFWVSDM